MGFITYVIVGFLLISLPFAQETNIPAIDNLFNVVSAMSTTGLVAGSVPEYYTFFGKLVLLGLIQLGAVGYMTLTSFFILARNDKISTVRIKVLSAAFAMPEFFELKKFIKNIIIYTFIIELIGALLLWHQFALLRLDTPLWSGIFHSVSAFATAGFSLYADNLAGFRDNLAINLIIIFLCYAGSIGFIVPMDIYRRIKGESKEITFTSKIIIVITALVVFIGTLIYTGVAHSDILDAFFQVMSASTTAGFNTVDISKLPKAVLLVIIFAMVIGASPSGTGGGIKTTSVSALLGVISSVMRGHPENITFFKRTIPPNRVMTAVAHGSAYILVLSISTLLVCIVDSHSFIQLFF